MKITILIITQCASRCICCIYFFNFIFILFFSPILSEENSALKEFLEKTSKMNPEERAVFLEKDDVRKTLKMKNLY